MTINILDQDIVKPCKQAVTSAAVAIVDG